MDEHQTIRIPVTSAVKHMTMTAHIEVTGLRWWRMRLWLGVRLLRLGAWVIGCHIHVDPVIRREEPQ